MKFKLENIATIQSGIFSLFGQLGSAIYLQANYFNEFGELKNTIRPNLVLNDKTERHLLDEGDILLAAKGNKNFAVLVKNKMLPAVASSTFLVLRIKREYLTKIIPEFLVWLLNHSHNQSILKSKAVGSGVPSISKKSLSDFNVDIPEMTTQQNILVVDELRKREKQIKQKIEQLREMQMQQLLYNLKQPKAFAHGK